MSVSLSLSSPSKNITLRNPTLGNIVGESIPVVQGENLAGAPYYYDHNSEVRWQVLRLAFEWLTDNEKEALVDFFRAARGAYAEWTYTDHRGSSYTVHFDSSSISFAETIDSTASTGTFTCSGTEVIPTSTREKGRWSTAFSLKVRVDVGT